MGDADDPKRLIAQAYAMEGVGLAEARAIFLDWALAAEGDARPAVRRLLARHGEAGHPMTAVLEGALEAGPTARRRGGARGRRSGG